MKIRIGTRGSKLARWQADWVAKELKEQEVDVEIVFVETRGDVKTGPIGSVGGEGLFTKEIQRALLDDRVDLAVHSLKDLPTEPHEGLRLAAVPKRAACGDALIANAEETIAQLPANATIGTGSARRRAQLLAYRPDLRVVDLRGNVDTRLQKLRAGEMDAIVLAEAGLHRLGLADQITEVLSKEIVLPAVGQGALGLEVRSEDQATSAAIDFFNDDASRQAVIAERSLLRALRGGCLAPVGAWGRIEAEQLVLDAVVLSADGAHRVATTVNSSPEMAEELGILAAEQLIAQGASELLDAARQT